MCTIFFSYSLGMIRLPKVAKSAVKNRPVPRPSLVNIVKELGKCPIGIHYYSPTLPSLYIHNQMVVALNLVYLNQASMELVI